jgi:predicted PurR-regulated permease PerM
MQRESVGRLIFLGLFLFTLYLMYQIFRPFLPGICWAIILAVAFQPLYQRLCGWMRGRTWLAASTLSVLVAAFIVVPATLALVKAGKGLVDGYRWLERSYQESGPGLGLEEKIPWLTDVADYLQRWVDLEAIDLKKAGIVTLQKLGNAVVANTGSVLADTMATLLTFAVLLVVMAYLFHEGPALVQRVHRFVPLDEADREAAFAELRDVTRAVFLGVLVTAFLQAAAGSVGYAIAGLPAPVTFGVVTFFCALLPAGTAVVWVPAAIWLLATGETWQGIFLAVWGVVVVSSIDNFVRPLFIGRGVRLPMLLVFFGIFGGMIAFGLLGLFLGPIVITFFLFLLNVLRRDLFPETERAPRESAT